MPSCSNSSNITSLINNISVTQGGSRLVVGVTGSGLTSGQVIRYDITTSGYTASKADNSANAEVFGVIEGYNSTTSSYDAVIYGSIIYPTAKLADMGSAGGSGGNDIYFLSGQTAGVLQNLAPENLDHIVKPIYQAAPHGSYTGVVVNYLGYKISGEVLASSLDGESVGGLQTIIGNSTFDDGYVDASVSHQLAIEDYPEFYDTFNTTYGFIEKLTVSTSETIPGSVTSEKTVTQSSSAYSGTVSTVDYANKIIYVSRPANASLASTNKKVNIAGTQTTITNSQVYAVYTPKIRISEPLVIQTNDGSNPVTQTIKVGIKVKPTQSRVSIPTTISANTINTTTLLLGPSGDNVSTVLSNILSRLTTIENTLIM
jgi:hypothetical protein